jgi:N-methylhydantoinase A/oxoprolinase/acetone carboxylase beta subunit
MAILLGIDTGGTYTDAVLFDDVDGVIASAKALTTKYDLTVGIREAIDRVLGNGSNPADVRLVSLSTTLATNAIVEGHGAPVGLLLIGYPPDALDLEGLRQAMRGDPVAFIQGGHSVLGDEQSPLDLDGARRAIEAFAPRVAAFAISGYFAVRNPAHELAVRQLVRDMTDRPVTCGHELTSNLNAPRRALTAALNARLIPFLQQLVIAVRTMLDEKGIEAPLMVVKGDGSLVDAGLALERPVETILSGPAASVVGARHLSGESDMLVVDMGGTTTDIALLRGGRPVLNLDGAIVGGWRTMVEAVAIHTFGLGGDSEVTASDTEPEGLTIGPRRVVPLSLLAYQYPETLDVLERQCRRRSGTPHDGQFVLRQRPLGGAQGQLSSLEQQMWEATAEGPVPLERLMWDTRNTYFIRQAVTHLIERGLLVASAFTPTDAAHILGYQRDWSVEAAQRGAELWLRARRTTASGAADDVPGLCQRVLRQVTLQAGRAVVGVAVAEAYGVDVNTCLPLRQLFVDRALMQRNGHSNVLDVSLMLNHALVAIGAPVQTYYPPVAERLHTRLCIPPHAEIANAVGAVAGGVMQTVRLEIKPLDEGELLRVHLPTGNRDFTTLDEAADCAEREASALAEARARAAGAEDVQVQVVRKDNRVVLKTQEVYLGSEVTATAVGRPRLAQR